MEITENLRNEIALSLPILGLKEANNIARECMCSNDKVYREWRKIRGVEKGRTKMEDPVVQAIVDLAIKRKKEAKESAKRAKQFMKQLSQA